MIEFQDRIQKNPRLLRLKNPTTGEIIDWEIQDLSTDEIEQEGTEISARVLNQMQEDLIKQTEKLIYSKVTTEEDANGFDITEIKIEDGKQYKIIAEGGILGESNGTLTLCIPQSDGSIIRNTILVANSDGSVINYYSTTNNIKLFRAYENYFSIGETILTYANGLVVAMTNTISAGVGIDTSTNSRSGTMLGVCTGDITTLQIKASTGYTIRPGTKIKIFELP